MSEHWATVAEAINERVDQLGWRQRELAERSQVSQAIVREIQHHTVERRRSSRTLESLSTTLGWHPQHLGALLHGRTPPVLEESSAGSQAIQSRLDGFEERLAEINERLDELKSDIATVIDHLRANQ